MGDSSDDFFNSFDTAIPTQTARIRRPGGPPPGPRPSASTIPPKKSPPPPPPPGARPAANSINSSASVTVRGASAVGISNNRSTPTITSLRKPGSGGPPQKQQQQYAPASSSTSYYAQSGGGITPGTVPPAVMPTTSSQAGMHQHHQMSNNDFGSDWYSPTAQKPVVQHPQPQVPSMMPSYSGYGGSYGSSTMAVQQQHYSQSAPSTSAAHFAGTMDSSGHSAAPLGNSVGESTVFAPQPTIMNPYATTQSSAMDINTTNSATNTPATAMLSGGYNDLDDLTNEPPLLEELGINVEHIFMKTKAIVIPFRRFSKNSALVEPSMIVEDADLAGPLAFALLLGGELMLAGKLQFGYIYGFGMFGCLSMTLILNLMTPGTTAVSFWTVTSILGYALLPVNVLAATKIVLLNLAGLLTLTKFLAVFTVIWSTFASTRLLEVGCGMEAQRYLLAYPIALLYSAFVLITIF